MNIESHPVFGNIPEGEPVRIIFEGQEYLARRGMTVAAALMANGIYKLGQSRNLSQARGLYCGSGRCQSCLMTIDGVEHVRSCITIVRDGMVIKQSIGDPDVLNSDIYPPAGGVKSPDRI
jgi:sarcosine oxidase subunit alpha